MSIYPLFFLSVFVFGSLVSLISGPIWGLVVYVYVYFNIPNSQWWGSQLPDLRWSFLSAIVLMVSCFFHRDKLSLQKWKENHIGCFLLFLLSLMIVLVPFTPYPDLSWLKVYDFFRYVLILFIVAKVLSDYHRYKIFLGVLLGCTFYLTILAHHYFDGSRLDGVGLPDAGSANLLAGVMVLTIPLFVVVIITETNWQRWAALLALPFVLNTFIMCGSRGAFVGLAMQGVVALWLLRKRLGVAKAIACCSIVAIGLLSLMSDQYRDRLLGLNQALDEDKIVDASAGRWEIWKHGMVMVKDYPLGAGGGAFTRLSPSYIPAYLLTGGVRASHNTYLSVLVEQGVLGLIVFFIFLRCQFSMLIKLRRNLLCQSPENSILKNNNIVFHSYALHVSLAGFWTTAFFADRVYFEMIYLVVAIVPAFSHIAVNIKNDTIVSN